MTNRKAERRFDIRPWTIGPEAVSLTPKDLAVNGELEPNNAPTFFAGAGICDLIAEWMSKEVQEAYVVLIRAMSKEAHQWTPEQRGDLANMLAGYIAIPYSYDPDEPPGTISPIAPKIGPS